MRAFSRYCSLILVAVFCNGCLTSLNRAFDTYEDEVDLSTVEDVESAAVLRGSMGETLFWSWDCWIEYPARAKHVIVDPGFIDITVDCEYGGLSHGWYQTSFVNIDVIAGHTYKATTGFSSCIRLRDVESKKFVGEGASGC